MISASRKRRRTSRPHEMARLQQELAGVIVAATRTSRRSCPCIGGAAHAPIRDCIYHALKPRDERATLPCEIINRLRPKLAQVQGASSDPAARPGHHCRRSADARLFQYTLQEHESDELSTWSQKLLARLEQCPSSSILSTDQETNGPTVTLTINRDTAARFGIQPQLIDDTL